MSDPLLVEVRGVCSQRSAVVGLGVVPRNEDGLYTLYWHMSLRLGSAGAEAKVCPRGEFKLTNLESADGLGFWVLHLKYCEKAAKLWF